MHAGFIPDFAKATNRRAGKAAPFGGVKPGADDGHIQDSLVYPTCYNITCRSSGKMKPLTFRTSIEFPFPNIGSVELENPVHAVG